MKKFIYAILAVFLITNSCYQDEMDRTIFIADTVDSNLPAYTEWGYNSFGALYERKYFLASEKIIPCKIIYEKGRMNFNLTGKIDRDIDMALKFTFPAPRMNHYKDLLVLNNTTINLLDDNCSVKIETNSKEDNITLISGNLIFKRAQLLTIDGDVNRVILSGVFELRFLKEGSPETISNGRFDFGINNDFYSLQE